MLLSSRAEIALKSQAPVEYFHSTAYHQRFIKNHFLHQPIIFQHFTHQRKEAGEKVNYVKVKACFPTMDKFKLELTLGTEECPIRTVVSILIKDQTIPKKWLQLASHFGISGSRIAKFAEDLRLKTIQHHDVIRDMLELWTSHVGSRATLDALLQILETKLEATGAGESLRLEFNLPCRASAENSLLEWPSLGIPFQSKVIQNLAKHLPPGDIEDGLLQRLKGDELIRLMTGEGGEPFQHTIPKPLSYYVDRNMLTRHLISSEIFDKPSSPDMFMFMKLDKLELGSLLSGKDNAEISSSTQRLHHHSAVKFMTLDHPHHFDKLGDRASSPLHLLNWEACGDKLKWIKSRGEMGTIQEFLENASRQDVVNEKDFVANLDSESNQPICISDGPGSGKSVLLAQIGRSLLTLYPGRTVVFAPLTEFIDVIKEDGGGGRKISAIQTGLERMTCRNELERAVLASKLRLQEGVSIELLLDGFDELHSDDYELAYGILAVIKNSIKSIRLWVTARQHVLLELENCLNTLGYNIRPFTEENQVAFLASFWSQNSQLDKEKLSNFAEKCLALLKSNMETKDIEIAGIPLLCLLIGEVYTDEAESYSREEEPTTPKVLVHSVTDLYKYVVAKKLQQSLTVQGHASSIPGDISKTEELTKMHVRLSMELVFPKQHENLKASHGPVVMEEVLKVGILETSGSIIRPPRFIHRTFADYFIARFIMEKLNHAEGWTEELTEFLLKGALSCTRKHVQLNFISKSIDSSEFAHPVIPYFLDNMLADYKELPDYFHRGLIRCTDPILVRDIAHACANSNNFHLLTFLVEMSLAEKYLEQIFNHDFFLLTIKSSNCKLAKYAANRMANYHILTFPMKVESIRLAARIGAFSIVEFLLKEMGLVEFIENPADEMRNILHDCVEDSKNNSKEEIDQKIQIIRTLVEMNRALLEENNQKGNTPLLSNLVHVRLLTELIQDGADVLREDDNKETIIHMSISREHISSQDYHSLLLNIPEPDLMALVKKRGEYGYTPLARLVEKIDPVPATLEKFSQVGADFKFVHENGDNVLAICTEWGRSPTTLSKLIDLGADANWMGRKGETLLHLAALNGNLEIAQLLMNEHEMGVNVEDADGHTPLDYAVRSNIGSTKRFDTGLVLQQRGGTYKVVEGQSPIHLAALEQNLQSIRFLLNSGMSVDVNATDEEGDTPLHKLQTCVWAQSKIDILEQLLAAGSDPNALNRIGLTPFHLALRKGHLDMDIFNLLKSKTNVKWTPPLATLALKTLIQKGSFLNFHEFESLFEELETYGAYLKHSDAQGDTLLHIAVNHGHDRALSFLLEKRGMDIRAKNNEQETLLHKAAKHSDTQIYHKIKYLVEQGADPLAKNSSGETFLHVFLLQTKIQPLAPLFHVIAEYLIAVQGLVGLFQIPTKDGILPIHLILSKMEPQLNTLLLLDLNGISSIEVDPKGNSALHYAVTSGKSTALLSALINQFKVDPALLNNNKESMLHVAAQSGTLEALNLFLELGTLQVNGVTLNEGYTPLHSTVAQKRSVNISEKCALLIEHGADGTILTMKGESSLELAFRQGGVELLALRNILPVPTLPLKVRNDSQSTPEVPLLPIFMKGPADLEGHAHAHASLHNYISYPPHPSPDQFHSLVDYLIGTGSVGLFHTHRMGDGATPLMLAVQHLEPEHKTLELLHSTGVNFNSVDRIGESVLAYAIEGKRSIPFLSILITHFGGDVKTLNHFKCSLLYKASFSGSVETLKFLLDMNALDVNWKNAYGSSPLHYAVPQTFHTLETHNESLVKCRLLVSKGADVNSRSNDHGTPLHSAASYKDREVGLAVIKFLVDNGADIYAKDGSGFTLLHSYIWSAPSPTDLHSLVEYLVEMKATSLFESDAMKTERTILQMLVSSVEPELKTMSLLHSFNVSFNSVNKNGESVLRYAVLSNRSLEFISALVEKFGADPYKLTSDTGECLLHTAAYFGSLEVLKYFVELGGLDINLENTLGVTPLHCALHGDGKQLDVLEKCKLLVGAGADIDATIHRWNQTPLHLAVAVNDKDVWLETTKFLIDSGADVFKKDTNNMTFLNLYLNRTPQISPALFHLIVECLHERDYTSLFNVSRGANGLFPLHEALLKLEPEERTLELLRLNNVNFNAVDDDGDSLLAYAIEGNHSADLLSTLIKFGSDPKHLNKNGENLLHHAAASNHGSVQNLNFLLSLNIFNVDQPCHDGVSPLHYAVGSDSNLTVILEKCQLLVANGANINSVNEDNQTPLHYTVVRRNKDVTLDIIKFLISHHADLYAKDRIQHTFLETYLTAEPVPSHTEFHNLVEFLAGRNQLEIFDIPNEHGRTALHRAVRKLEPAIATLVILNSDIRRLNWVDRDEATILHHAICGQRRPGFLGILINDFGADPLHLDKFQNNILHDAALFGSVDMVKYILDLDILDVNDRNNYGNTALHLAIIAQKLTTKATAGDDVLEKCKLLVRKGADVNILNNQNHTALALMMGNYTGPDKDSLTTLLQTSKPFDIYDSMFKSLMQLSHDISSETYSTFLDSFPKELHSHFFGMTGEAGETPLMDMLLHKEPLPETLVKFKEGNADFNHLDKNGNSVISYAIRGKRSTETILSLISQFGADPKHLNEKGENFLHISVLHGTAEAVHLFLHMDYLDVNEGEHLGNSPLHLAMQPLVDVTDLREKAELLLAKGANINSINNQKETCLHLVADWEDKFIQLEVVQFLVSNKIDVFAKDSKDQTFLHTYILSNNRPDPDWFHLMVEYLLENGMKGLLETPGGKYKATPLHHALWELELEEKTLDLLHSSQIDFNSVDERGDSFVYYAIMGKRSHKCMSTLIKLCGGNGEIKNQTNLLHTAATSGSLEALAILLANGGLDVNAPDKNIGSTALHLALMHLRAENDALGKAKLLLRNGADINAADQLGNTSLHLVALKEDKRVSLELIKFLIKSGANIYAKARGLTFANCFLMTWNSASPSIFHSLVEFLVAEKCSDIFHIMPSGDGPGNPLMHDVVYYLEPEIRTLSLLKANNVDFNAVNRVGASVLHYAVAGKRSPHFISALIRDFGADPAYRAPSQNKDSEGSILHLSADLATVDVLQLFLDMELFNVNGKNSLGDTPLHRALQSKVDVLDKCRILINHGAGIATPNKKGESPLAYLMDNYSGPDKSQLISLLTPIEQIHLEAAFNEAQRHESDGQEYKLGRSTPDQVVKLLALMDGKMTVAGKNFLPPTFPLSGMIYQLLDSGLNLNCVDEAENSILLYAVRQKRGMARLISQFDANPRHVNKNGENLLHISAFEGDAGILKYFLDLGKQLDLNGRNIHGNTPLHFAVHPEGNQVDVFEKCKLLVSSGADPNQVNMFGETVLHLATYLADKDTSLKTIKYFVQAGVNLSARNRKGYLFLHNFLSSFCKPSPSQFHSLVEYLLAKGCAHLFDMTGGNFGVTPFQLAVYHLELKDYTLDLLHSANVNFNQVGKNGLTLCQFAIMGKRSAGLLSQLVSRGADWKACDGSGNTVIHTSVQWGTLEAVNFFLDLGGLDVSQANADGDTPLHCVSKRMDNEQVLEKCRLLIEFGADVNKLSGGGISPLTILLEAYEGLDKSELVELLMRGATQRKRGRSRVEVEAERTTN